MKIFTDFEQVTKMMKKDHNTGVEKFLIKNPIQSFKRVPYQGT